MKTLLRMSSERIRSLPGTNSHGTPLRVKPPNYKEEKLRMTFTQQDQTTRDQATLFDSIREIFEQKIPFNRVLGLRVVSLDHEIARLRFTMNEALIGNYMRGSMHGGVISSVIDVTGGLAAFLGMQAKLPDEPLTKRLRRFEKLGTIDLRIDYLTPGIGEWFEATGHVLRAGKKVAVTRIELCNQAKKRIAVGTGAYVIA